MMSYREWMTIAKTIAPNPFVMFESELSGLKMLPDLALEIFINDYETAVTRYSNEKIVQIFLQVKHTNEMKYEKLIAAANAEYNPISNYDMTEESNDVRTPDLTSQLTLNTTAAMIDSRATTTTGNSSTNSSINQTRMTTENPKDYKETTIHSISSYDNPVLTEEFKDETEQSGTRSVSESYTGSPDTTTVTGSSTATNSGGTSTTNTGTNIQKETGTDTTTHHLMRKGNIGVTTTQQMLESEIALADKMNIFKIIEQDIAAKIFLQVWI